MKDEFIIIDACKGFRAPGEAADQHQNISVGLIIFRLLVSRIIQESLGLNING